MPKTAKVSKDDILMGAIALVRESGYTALNARAIAARAGCSTQPIFSNYASMEELRQDILDYADDECFAYMQKETKAGKLPPFLAIGMAYVEFANDEKELFRMLYLDRQEESLTEGEDFGRVVSMIQRATGLDRVTAEQFYLSMWATIHGIAAMCATSYLEPDREMVTKILLDCYEGLKLRYEEH